MGRSSPHSSVRHDSWLTWSGKSHTTIGPLRGLVVGVCSNSSVMQIVRKRPSRTILLHPQAPEPHGSPYFSADAIAERGRAAIAALGDQPVATLEATSSRVIALVESTPADAAIGSPAGTMTLVAYLPSRVAELTIHGLDVGRAIGVEQSVPQSAMRASLHFLSDRAATRQPESVLLALSGREHLPEGYSVF